ATSLRRAGIQVEFSRGGKRRTRKIVICTAPKAEACSDNSWKSSSAPSASPHESESQSQNDGFRADSDLCGQPSAFRPPPSPRPPHQADSRADSPPPAGVRPNRLKDIEADRADTADGGFGPN